MKPALQGREVALEQACALVVTPLRCCRDKLGSGTTHDCSSWCRIWEGIVRGACCEFLRTGLSGLGPSPGDRSTTTLEEGRMPSLLSKHAGLVWSLPCGKLPDQQ